MYLQPSATGLIYENKKYEKDYMQSIKELSLLNKTNPEVRLGKKMIFLIRDFVYQLTDWEKEIEAKTPFSELYGKTWAECRNFVLPMNPVRRELEFAVKQTLIDLGVSSTIRQISKNTKQKKSENKAKTNSKNNLETLKEEIPAINQ